MVRRGRPRIRLELPPSLLEKYAAAKLTGREIAERYRVSLGVALRELRRRGLSAAIRRGRPRIELELPQTILTDYSAGRIDHHDVARLFGVSPRIALRELRRAGMDTSVRTRKRLRADSAALTVRDADVIRRYEQGRNLRTIGEELGLTPEGVRQVLVKHGVARRPRGRSCA